MIEAIGRYRVIRPLGRGGMGQVYLAEDPTLERQVAIKLLLRDPQNTGLLGEARTLAALHHPNIVTVHEVAEHEGRDYIVMEYVAGKTLRQLLVDGQTTRLVLREICAKVVLALGAAHRAGILHRDVKPENIFVGDDDEVKVIDFGIARRMTPRRSKRPTAREVVSALGAAVDGTTTEMDGGTQTVFGTPAYMAPEVLQGEPSSEASDVYSLGIVLHECFAGRRPYNPRSLAELIAQKIDAPPPVLDDPFGDLISRMLATDPTARPALDEVESELEAMETMIAPPPPRVRRGPWLAVGGIMVVLAVATVLLVRDRASGEDELPALPLAVMPVEIKTNLFGNGGPERDTVTAALIERLANVAGGARLTPKPRPDPEDKTAIADVLVVSIATKDRSLIATVQLLGPNAHAWTIGATERIASLGKLFDQIVDTVAFELVGSHSTHHDDAEEANRFYLAGKYWVDAYKFDEARVWLEAAIQADQKHFRAWYALALVMGWQGVEEFEATAQKARELAPVSERALLTGMLEFHAGNYAAARAQLEPLDRADVPDRRAVVYHLAEALWHDGHHKEAYDLFDRISEDPGLANANVVLSPIRIHMFEYWFARREFVRAAQFAGGGRDQRVRIEFAAGRYKEVANIDDGRDYSPLKTGALEILGRPVPEHLRDVAFGKGTVERASYEITHALRVGDVPGARAQLETLEQTLRGRLETYQLHSLYQLVDAFLVAGKIEDARRLLSAVSDRAVGPERDGYRRRAVLLAGATRDPTLIPTGMNYRQEQVAQAMRAEIAGDHATAATVLWSVVRSPLIHMDLPERAALLRNLRALRRTREAAALCADTLKPYEYRHALLPFLTLCGR